MDFGLTMAMAAYLDEVNAREVACIESCLQFSDRCFIQIGQNWFLCAINQRRS